jgi:hypothetical protein
MLGQSEDDLGLADLFYTRGDEFGHSLDSGQTKRCLSVGM